MSARLDEQGLYWFTGGRVAVGSSWRRHHLEIEAKDRKQALDSIREAIARAGGDAENLDLV